MEPLDREHISLARRMLAERGQEYTPDEVLELAENALDNLRQQMESQNIICPEDNKDLIRLIGFFIMFFGIKPTGIPEL